MSLASERLKALDEAMDECWRWPGQINGGYGLVRQHPKIIVHRLMYEKFSGASLTSANLIHHRCQNRACFNPTHLELTTRAGHPQLHEPTHCIRGHEFTPENTHVRADGGRACKTCSNERHRERYARDPEYRQRRIDARRRSRERQSSP